MDTYRNFIGGKWIESTSAKTVNNINPANTDDLIGSVRQATREEARAAVEAAAEAFHGPAGGCRPGDDAAAGGKCEPT